MMCTVTKPRQAHVTYNGCELSKLVRTWLSKRAHTKINFGQCKREGTPSCVANFYPTNKWGVRELVYDEARTPETANEDNLTLSNKSRHAHNATCVSIVAAFSPAASFFLEVASI